MLKQQQLIIRNSVDNIIQHASHGYTHVSFVEARKSSSCRTSSVKIHLSRGTVSVKRELFSIELNVVMIVLGSFSSMDGLRHSYSFRERIRTSSSGHALVILALKTFCVNSNRSSYFIITLRNSKFQFFFSREFRSSPNSFIDSQHGISVMTSGSIRRSSFRSDVHSILSFHDSASDSVITIHVQS